MPRRTDDNRHHFMTFRHNQRGGYSMFLPSNDFFKDSGNYAQLWFAAQNFKLYWESILKREMSSTDWFDALSIQLVTHMRCNGAIVDTEQGQEIEFPDIDETFGNVDEGIDEKSTHWLSEAISKVG